MMKNKGVSFNVSKQEEKELLEFAERNYKNFSGRVKEWIKKDYENARNRRGRTEAGGIRINL
jgi:hypothetical protein